MNVETRLNIPAPGQEPLRNHLLDRMNPAVRDALVAAARYERLPGGASLSAERARSAQLVFPTSGLLSARIGTDAEPSVEIVMIGREGVVGKAGPACVAIPFRMVAMTEVQALRVDLAGLSEALQGEVARDPTLARYQEVVVIQMGQSTLAAARRTVVERLARWLLMCFDRLDADTVMVTHDALSAALGVRRPGVTVATHDLEGVGAIRAKRGAIRLLDRPRLIAASRGSYGVPEKEYARQIGELPPRGGAGQSERTSRPLEGLLTSAPS